MANALQPWHLIILVLVVVLLFGAKRLPDAARSIGKSMKIFKAETKGMRESGQAADSETATSATTEPDTRQLPESTTTPAASSTSTDEKVEQLQRQLDELKRQQAAQQQEQKNAS
ncbi:Sec-independent protein translocase subunit TatA [Saccharomonospora sp.]|uniref:Sec-independent protein translocase subunit TatA n=1 Tax=Saccharomonospora sp. TaxID=33913 RepID=UPI0026024FE1|nr:Sec-independent protein translocase subunit TatA [Saccharomonospora sp.]